MRACVFLPDPKCYSVGSLPNKQEKGLRIAVAFVCTVLDHSREKRKKINRHDDTISHVFESGREWGEVE